MMRPIDKLRDRQVKNLLTVTMLSLGVPMILMGDEARRTQFGNNNAYGQDNETSWFDWEFLDKHREVHRFTRLLIHRRLQRDLTPERERLTLNELLNRANKTWHGTERNQPDWSNDSHSLAFCAGLRNEGLFVYLILNAYWEPLEFEIPQLPEGNRNEWRRWIDTSLQSPDDIVDWRTAALVAPSTYRAGPRSVVVLLGD